MAMTSTEACALYQSLNEKEEEILSLLDEATGNLQGKSKDEQALVIFNKRDEIIRGVTVLQQKVLAVNGEYSLSAISYRLFMMFGFDPVKTFTPEGIDESECRMAVEALSDSNLWAALTKAGQVFQELKSPYLHFDTLTIKKTAKELNQNVIDGLVNAIVNFCQAIVVAASSGSIAAIPPMMNKQDITAMISSFVATVVNSYTQQSEIKKKIEAPIVTPGQYGWAKYDLCATINAEVKCFSSEQFLKFQINKWNFLFPDEASFRHALSEIVQSKRRSVAEEANRIKTCETCKSEKPSIMGKIKKLYLSG